MLLSTWRTFSFSDALFFARYILQPFVFSSAFFPVPAQPSSFEAEAELDTRIVLTWLWPVQDPITKYELQYWETGSENKVRILKKTLCNNYFSYAACPPVCLTLP